MEQFQEHIVVDILKPFRFRGRNSLSFVSIFLSLLPIPMLSSGVAVVVGAAYVTMYACHVCVPLNNSVLPGDGSFLEVEFVSSSIVLIVFCRLLSLPPPHYGPSVST